MAENDVEDFLEQLDNPEAARPEIVNISSRLALALAALTAALDRGELKYGHASPGVVIVEVPGRTWLKETASAARQVWPKFSVSTVGGEKKSVSPTQEEVLRHASWGKGVVVITPSAKNSIIEPLVAAARLSVRVVMPERAVLLQVVKEMVTGRIGRAFDNIALERLDFDTFCACVVPRSTAKGCAFRVGAALGRLHPPKDDSAIPELSTVAGYGEAKKWAIDLVADLSRYRAGHLFWSEVANGAVLWGPPGTGKTMFARIVAKAARIPLVMTSVAEYFAVGGGHLDDVIKQQRAAFEKAAASAPCVLFVDELDALPARGLGGRNENYWAPVITDFLTLLDSSMFDRAGIVVIAATNRLHSIDGAILRPGRLGAHLHVPAPDIEALERILRFHLGGDFEGFDLLPLLRAREGATGADAAGWARSARRSARAANRPVSFDDLASVICPPVERTDEDEYRIAIHEAGHAVAAITKGLPVSTVTIVPAGTNAGTTSFSERRRQVMTKSDTEDVVVAVLAGRAAEAVFFGDEPSTAAGGDQNSDLAQATTRVTEWHTVMGMGSRLTWNVGALGVLDFPMRDAIEADIQRLYRAAVELMTKRRPLVEAVARHLIKYRAISGEELRSLVKEPPIDGIGF